MKKILNKKFIKAFTLVELIIVITILAILATIVFISFQGYSKNARDSNRLSTITNLGKGLDIYGVQVGNFPEPEGTILSGSLDGVQLNRLGVIGDNISRLLKSNKIPQDLTSGNNYVYGVSTNNKYYQIGVTLENLESYNSIIKNVNADNGSFKSKVVGNYKYPLNYNGKLYSLPSLLFTGTGGDLSQTGSAYFIVDKGLNIPYTLDKTPLNNTQSTTFVLQSLTGTGGLTLTGINIPSITSTEFKALTSTSATLQNLQQGLGVTDQAQLGNIIYGSSYSTNTNINNGPFGTFNLSSLNVPVGTNVMITDNCTLSPTSYISSNISVATVSGTLITTISSGTTNIIPVGGNCNDISAKALIVTIPVFLQNCKNISSNSSSSGGIIYTNSGGIEIARVSNIGATISGTPGSLDCSGNIIVCVGSGTGYILSSCNLGSSTVGTSSSSYGYYYQWGNSGGTPSGSIGLTSSLVSNASLYGPGTANGYYSSTAFIGSPGSVSPFDWASPQNDNLWGSGGTVLQRQGPCPTNYHIPTGLSTGEWQAIYNAGGWSGIGSNPGTGFSNSLKLPFSGNRHRGDGVMANQGSYGFYRSSSPDVTNGSNLTLSNTSIGMGAYYRIQGFSLRCFRN